MKNFFTLILLRLLLNATALFAQQDPQFSHYMNNKLFMNPAYAGMRRALCMSAIYRNQWNGFEGAPNSGVFSADLALPDERGGVGFNLMYDKLGFENNLNFNGNYSKHFELKNQAKLGIGIEVGGFSKRLGPSGNQQWLATTNWQADASIPPQIKKTVLDFGLGIWYQDPKLWFGISSSHLNGKLIDDGSETVNYQNQSTTHHLIFQMARHYFITGGVNLFQTNIWEIKPSFLIKTDGTITTVDLNVTVVYKNRFWFGASYRYKDAICPMAGFLIPISSFNPDLGLKVGFAYDYTTSHLKNYNNGTFEIFLNYCIPVEWIKGWHRDTRIFL